MNKQKKFNYLRIGVAAILIAAGVVFLFIPFLPLGYILIFSGLFLVARNTLLFKRIMHVFKKNGNKKKIEDAENKINDAERKIYKGM